MRLDKFLCDALGTTRKESTQLLKSGDVTVDGIVRKSGSCQVTELSQVEWQGRALTLSGPRYIMLHKPQGYVCSHEDSFNQTAFVLLDEANQRDLHFAGRLDVDTTGLVLITDDGQWSHRVTSPKHHCEKTYRVWLADPITAEYTEQFAKGIELRGERDLTRPAQLEIIDQQQVLLTIHEGKYHQVKRMFAALGNKVVGLHRERVGDIVLDPGLEPGESRYLTESEIASVWN
ncbi:MULTISPECIES: 16S rRNA pseudouridine(516) synthase RsuA [Vibrio]|uniref:Pseudouridine synthase n=2 Tax=Bacteria TaxID=2 RepID=A0A9X0ULI8_VIBME|nr:MULTISPECIES: 16S rRNA pseudouridine(516) synthase RsuA [Vibrio]EKO3564185.1 16S rRNA pseudouridine(516) synthase RsuA [Vibrio metschnikovii]EKO3571126.1 16S rRNA pseudouridine(516) synthase RsuA [Vibrio metschnikovii]EKO3768020.1 16S rRNA pseudouridine(516) synthase RsuA [Vibrio metschnikovii]EKO3920125.1 16S rRNA pseudouridine(516) synthase RsuA [Vibrio metschnikovii]MBC5850113.1 16S rRNA pseudouridine(516) synthase RsuA [Vibrio metschnikovii]